MSEQDKSFVARWSQRKEAAREREAATPATVAKPEEADSPPPELPPIETLTKDSDFRPFFHPKVDAKLRQAALRKLFSDPHFNIMDGLDTYIDDYSVSEPIPAAMLAQLQQARRIIDWAQESRDDRERERLAREAAGGQGARGAEGARDSDAAIPLADSAPAQHAQPVADRSIAAELASGVASGKVPGAAGNDGK